LHASRALADVAEDQGLFAGSDAYCSGSERAVFGSAESELRRVGRIEHRGDGQPLSADKR
jgi:hypothetical protein